MGPKGFKKSLLSYAFNKAIYLLHWLNLELDDLIIYQDY